MPWVLQETVVRSGSPNARREYYDQMFSFSAGRVRYIVKPGYNDWPQSDIHFKFGLREYLHVNGSDRVGDNAFASTGPYT